MSVVQFNIETGEMTIRDYTDSELEGVAQIAAAIPKPTSVTMRQARLALLQAGHLSSVQAAISSIEDAIIRQASQIEWEYAATVDRDSSFTQGMAAALGLTETDMDNLFTLAASL